MPAGRRHVLAYKHPANCVKMCRNYSHSNFVSGAVEPNISMGWGAARRNINTRLQIAKHMIRLTWAAFQYVCAQRTWQILIWQMQVTQVSQLWQTNYRRHLQCMPIVSSRRSLYKALLEFWQRLTQYFAFTSSCKIFVLLWLFQILFAGPPDLLGHWSTDFWFS